MQHQPESGTYTHDAEDEQSDGLTEEQRQALPPMSRIALIEKEQYRVRANMDELRGDVKAILRGVGTLTTDLENTLARVDRQGWTRWTVRVAAASSACIAAALIGICWLTWVASKTPP